MKQKITTKGKKVSAKKAITKTVAVATKIAVGKKAPKFSMESTDGRIVSTTGLKGSRYVLYFYPKDMTSGCTNRGT